MFTNKVGVNSKAVDIWLFGGVSVPFVIIGILIILDYLVMREINGVIELQKEDEIKWNSKSFIKTMRISLPIAAGFLMGTYWLIGLTYYFN